MKKSLYSLSVLASSMFLFSASCGVEEQPENVASYPQLIVGNWTTDTRNHRYTFNSNGSFSSDEVGVSADYSGTYSITGAKLKQVYRLVYQGNIENGVVIYNIRKLNNTSLELSPYSITVGGNTSLQNGQTEYYNRVN